MRGNRECKPHIHAARVAFDRRIDKLFDFCEGDDLIEFVFDLSSPHAQDGAIKINVLATCELSMKSSAHFKKRPDPSVNFYSSGRRVSNSRKDLEKRALSGAVPTDNSNDFPVFDFERNVLERPDGSRCA